MCGNVSESCPQLKCDKSQQVKDAGKCCARCDNAPSTQSQGREMVSLDMCLCWLMFHIATCTENGIIYQEGDVWNPYFSKFGVIKCQICTCKVRNCFYTILSVFNDFNVIEWYKL